MKKIITILDTVLILFSSCGEKRSKSGRDQIPGHDEFPINLVQKVSFQIVTNSD